MKKIGHRRNLLAYLRNTDITRYRDWSSHWVYVVNFDNLEALRYGGLFLLSSARIFYRAQFGLLHSWIKCDKL